MDIMAILDVGNGLMPQNKGLVIPSTFVQCKMENSKEIESKHDDDEIKINDRVKTKGGKYGYVKYIGKVANNPVIMYGLQLDNGISNDGSFNSVKYFTAPMGKGYFTVKNDIIKVDEYENINDIPGQYCVIVAICQK